MTKTSIFTVICFIHLFAFGQTSPVIKNIFYGLPLDKSRSELREVLVLDRRFELTDTLSNLFKNSMPYFLGRTSDKGIVKSKPDSIEIHLTWGNGNFFTSDNWKKESQNALLLNLKYFYSSKDSVEKEYESISKKLSSVFKSSYETSSKTTYSKDTTFSHAHTEGRTFESPDLNNYNVTLSRASLTNRVFGLYIEFTKKED